MLTFDKLLDEYEEAIREYDYHAECGTVAAMERSKAKMAAAKEALRKHFAERMK